jgi:hypothetical protein
MSGPYEFRTDLGEDLRHCRAVDWMAIDIPPWMTSRGVVEK